MINANFNWFLRYFEHLQDRMTRRLVGKSLRGSMFWMAM
jgi:hypothetical protein